MKKLHMSLLVIAAVIMSFIAVQNVNADTVSGTITDIDYRPNIVEVDGTDVYSVPIKYLIRHLDAPIAIGQYVSFDVSEFYCPSADEWRYRFEDINLQLP